MPLKAAVCKIMLDKVALLIKPCLLNILKDGKKNKMFSILWPWYLKVLILPLKIAKDHDCGVTFM